jgi:hypothetical protein
MIGSKAVLQKGIFLLSLDLELCWGVVDKPRLLKKNKIYYEQARDCIEKILMLLEKYNISATWAIVGHLFLKECNLINGQKHIDIPRSTYPRYAKDWFEESPCTCHKEDPLWYGQDIIEKIINCRVHQEIACHSFAHIPYGDRNTKRVTVQSDLSKCLCEAVKFDLRLRSFVFPRNNIGYIDELSNFGFEAFRGEEPSWYRGFTSKLKKVCHIIDQILAISPPVTLPEHQQGLYNIPASMFYLPMNGFRSIIPVEVRIFKAKKGIRRAIRQKKIFHLWFHPFNIATNQVKLLYGLEEILKEVISNREKGQLEVRSMDEIVDLMGLYQGDDISEE